MPHGTKIATCCYCGTRAALVLKGESRHELSCAACGAPVHEMKMLRSGKVDAAVAKARHHAHAPATLPRRGAVGSVPAWGHGPSKNRKMKTRKTMAKRLFKQAFDVLEDIFD